MLLISLITADLHVGFIEIISVYLQSIKLSTGGWKLRHETFFLEFFRGAAFI